MNFLNINLTRRESHSRRREPGHIPRPRNAFIIFRSFYVYDRKSAGEGQQNELSKQAGKVWNRMTEKERSPFVERAATEKRQHQAKYPNYTYCPGRGAARRRVRDSEPKRKMSAASSSSSTTSASSEPTFVPEVPFAAPTQRPIRAAAQRAIEKFQHPHSISPSPCPMSLTPDESPMLEDLKLASNPDTLVFTRTINSPVRAPTPIKKEVQEPKLQCDLNMWPAHLDRIPEQFGFKYHSDPSAMLAYLPPMPNANDDAECTGDVPSLFAQLSRHPANLPTTLCMTDDDPVFFLPDGSIAKSWSQSMTRDDFRYMSMVSENMWPEDDIDFMNSCFDFSK